MQVMRDFSVTDDQDVAQQHVEQMGVLRLVPNKVDRPPEIPSPAIGEGGDGVFGDAREHSKRRFPLSVFLEILQDR